MGCTSQSRFVARKRARYPERTVNQKEKHSKVLFPETYHGQSVLEIKEVLDALVELGLRDVRAEFPDHDGGHATDEGLVGSHLFGVSVLVEVEFPGQGQRGLVNLFRKQSAR